MSRRKQQNVVAVLESAEAYARAVEDSQKFLTGASPAAVGLRVFVSWARR
jgi:hypothetical protein